VFDASKESAMVLLWFRFRLCLHTPNRTLVVSRTGCMYLRRALLHVIVAETLGDTLLLLSSLPKKTDSHLPTFAFLLISMVAVDERASAYLRMWYESVLVSKPNQSNRIETCFVRKCHTHTKIDKRQYVRGL